MVRLKLQGEGVIVAVLADGRRSTLAVPLPPKAVSRLPSVL